MARINEVRKGLLGLVAAFWNPTAPDEIVDQLVYDIDDPDTLSRLTGRKVLVWPEGFNSFSATRGADTYDWGFQVRIIKRYEQPGYPDNEWMEAELDFLFELQEYLGDNRREPYMPISPEMVPEELEINSLFDVYEIHGNKVFVAAIMLVLREDIEQV